MATANEELISAFESQAELSIDLITAAHEESPPGVENVTERIRIIRIASPRKSIHHATVSNLAHFLFASFREANRRIKKKNGYDLIFAWAGIPAGCTAWILKKRWNIPYVVRTSGPELPGFEARYTALGWIVSPILRSVFSRAGAVVCKSQREIELIRRISSDISVTVIPNAAPAHLWKRLPDEESRNSFPTILCVGRIIERKGQRLLLHALRQLQNQSIRVRFAGTGDDENFCKELTSELALTNQVTFLGYVSRESLIQEYRTADLMVLPSENEGMSFAILEAMASGLPIVATKGRGSEELVRSGENGFLVDWQDVSSLSSAIIRIVEDKESCRKMGHRSREIAMEFSWTAISEKYIELMKSLIK